MRNFTIAAVLTVLSLGQITWAGPYSLGAGDSGNVFDAPVPGFVGPAGDGKTGGGNYVNPEFLGWASGYQDVVIIYETSWEYTDPSLALGPVTANEFNVVSLGDLDSDMIAAGWAPGQIILTFDTPIRNGVGADFAVFENGFYSEWTTGEGTVVGEIHAELAYVWVSSNGADWLEFSSDSLTPQPAPSPYGYGYLTIDPTNVYNLAGKHANSHGKSWGTPFDLDEFVGHRDVLAGLIDLQQIKFVKIVDVPGSGDCVDGDGDPIYDAWVTWGTGGMDLEAVGVLNELPDFDFDGDVDGDDFDILCNNLGTSDLHYDLDNDGDADADDVAYLISNCLQWNSGSQSGYGVAAGDFNLDGRIDTVDLTILGTYFGSGTKWCQGNANLDDAVDTVDLTILATNFGFVATGPSIPEPATILVMGLGAMGLVRRRRGA